MSDTLSLGSGPLTFEHTTDVQGRRVLRVTEGLETAQVQPNGQPSPGPIGNTQGIIVPDTEPNPYGDSAPPVSPETEAERKWHDFMGAAKDAAQYYKDNVSESLHAFGGDAMHTGGNVAMAGGAMAGAGGLMAGTVVGAAPGAALVAGGAATGLAGGAVATTGVLTTTVATVFDSVADAIISGQPPQIIAPAISLGMRLLENGILRKVPGSGGGRSNRQSGGGRGGGYARGTARTDPRCKLRPYSEGCANGATPHHVVPDHVFRTTSGVRYEGAPGHRDGLSVCVQGKAKHTGADGKPIKRKMFDRARDYVKSLGQHGRIHIRTDSRELWLGLQGTPKGTTTLGQMEAVGARAVAAETGCDPRDLERQLREHHGSSPYNLPSNTRVRADPTGRVFDEPPFEIMGRPNRESGRMGD